VRTDRTTISRYAAEHHEGKKKTPRRSGPRVRVMPAEVATLGAEPPRAADAPAEGRGDKRNACVEL
jgi:hypothetical protein